MNIQKNSSKNSLKVKLHIFLEFIAQQKAKVLEQKLKEQENSCSMNIQKNSSKVKLHKFSEFITQQKV
ncbi:hypothetical protein KSP40_PGU010773 [Platanthera guangdongensis]|uniref:Uncharacterized protein n=1 Tax=Platanthera guangdongensis TaxID=2320717 RepID=A0ABR2M801_9ASPA